MDEKKKFPSYHLMKVNYREETRMYVFKDLYFLTHSCSEICYRYLCITIIMLLAALFLIVKNCNNKKYAVELWLCILDMEGLQKFVKKFRTVFLVRIPFVENKLRKYIHGIHLYITGSFLYIAIYITYNFYKR